MAKFSFNGVDSFEASLEQLARLSYEEKLSVIMPSAQLLLQRQKEKILSMFRRRTGDLEASLGLEAKESDEGPSVVLFFQGKHRGAYAGKRTRGGRPRGKYSGTNAEIAYILNYGSPRIKATHWLDNVNSETEREMVASQQEAWNDLLEKKGL